MLSMMLILYVIVIGSNSFQTNPCRLLVKHYFIFLPGKVATFKESTGLDKAPLNEIDAKKFSRPVRPSPIIQSEFGCWVNFPLLN